jgi:hypothetical protein
MIRILNIKPNKGKREFSIDYDENGKRRTDTVVFSKVVNASGEIFETLGSESYGFNEYIGAHPELKRTLFSILRESDGQSVKFPIQVNGNGKM